MSPAAVTVPLQYALVISSCGPLCLHVKAKRLAAVYTVALYRFISHLCGTGMVRYITITLVLVLVPVINYRLLQNIKRITLFVEIELQPRNVRYNKYELISVMGVKGEGNRSRVDK
jgi:hypothetical protein